jgi:hypothetical protein
LGKRRKAPLPNRRALRPTSRLKKSNDFVKRAPVGKQFSRTVKKETMNELKKIINTEINKVIEYNPYKNDNSLTGISGRLEYLSNNINSVTKKVETLCNEYSKNNPEVDNKKIILLAKNIVQEFISNNIG